MNSAWRGFVGIGGLVVGAVGWAAPPPAEPVEVVDYWKVKLPRPGTMEWEEARAALLDVRQRNHVVAREGWNKLVSRADDRWKIWDRGLVGGPVGGSVGTQRDFDDDGVWDWKDLCPSLPEDDLPDHLDDYFVDPEDGCPNNGRPESYRPGDMGLLGEGKIENYGELPWTDPGDYRALRAAKEAWRAGQLDEAAAQLALARSEGAHERLVGWLESEIVSAGGPRLADVVAAAPAPVVAPAPKRASLPSIDGRLPGATRHPQDAVVVVGIADYLRLPDVPFADRDAEAFRTWAVYTRGVPPERVQAVTAPASRDHIEEAVARAGREVGPGGTVWVYFAGHGAADPATGARMVLGDDAAADLTSFASRGVPVERLETLASAGGGRPVLLIDACFTGVGRDGAELFGGKRFAVPTYATSASAAGVQWNAAAPGQASGPLQDAQHGAFTYWAIGALRGWADGELDGVRDGVVTGQEAQAYVERALRAAQVRDQRPVWLGPPDVALSDGVQEAGPVLE